MNFSKKDLYLLYIINKLSSVKIAKIYHVAFSTIINYLKKYNIKIRSQKEAQTKYVIKHNFCEICQKSLANYSWKTNRCVKHQIKKIANLKGNKNPNWKGGKPHCTECGKELSSYNVKRCRSCANKLRAIKRWKNVQIREKTIKSWTIGNKLKPNKPEAILNNLIKNINLNYTYNDSININGFVPDFIDIKNKKIIEMFGDYWHNKLGAYNKDRRRKYHYKKYGYKTLVIWEHELKNTDKVKQKLINFTKGGNQ
jgi:G:T-mismatch repair DNA endonuclease (very short patch repair protein)